VGWTPGTRGRRDFAEDGCLHDYVLLPSWLLVPVPTVSTRRSLPRFRWDYLTAVSVLERHGRVATVTRCSSTAPAAAVGRALSQLGRLHGLRMYGHRLRSRQRGSGWHATASVHHYRRQDFEEAVRDRARRHSGPVFDHIGGRICVRDTGCSLPVACW